MRKTSKTFPIMCMVTALVLLLWPDLPNADWGETPTATDLLMVTFTTLGIVTWEIRNAIDEIRKASPQNNSKRGLYR